MGKKIDTISLVHPQTGEQLEGVLFPGYGGSGATTKAVSIPGNSKTVARYNHGHTTAEVQPGSGDQTNLYITQELLTKLSENTYTKTEVNVKISEIINGIKWGGTVDTFNDLPKSPYTGLEDGVVYSVLKAVTVSSEEKPAGTYRLHLEASHPIGMADGWYLISTDVTQLASANNAGSISADWYTKLNTILNTGFTGLVSSGGDNGTATTAARSNHVHSGYVKLASLQTTGEQEIGTPLVLKTIRNKTAGDVLSVEKSPAQIVLGNNSFDSIVIRRSGTRNLFSTKAGVSGYIWETHNLSETVVKFIKNLQKNPDSLFPGYGGTGGDWGSATTVARSDHSHSGYIKGTNNGGIWTMENGSSLVIPCNHQLPLTIKSTTTQANLKFSANSKESYITFDSATETFVFGKVKATTFTGALKGNADTATTATSAGNADTVDNKHASAAAETPEANKLPVYNTNGYLYASYFNAKNNVEPSINATNVIVENGDGFLRKTTAANFRAKATDPYYFKATGDSGIIDSSQLNTLAIRNSGTYQVNVTGASAQLTVFRNAGSAYALELYNTYGGEVLQFRTVIDGNRYNGDFVNIWTARSLTKLSQLTNDSGFITSSALGSYLPLSGGVMSGDINMNSRQITNTSQITFSSDRRLKTDFVAWSETSQKSKDDIEQIQATYFRFKSGNDNKQCGYIAQEVQKLFPEFVHPKEDGFLTVDYNSIFVSKIARLETENRSLKTKLKELETKLDKVLEMIENK